MVQGCSMEQRLDGSMAVMFRQCDLSVAECLAQPKMPSPRKPASAPRLRPKGVHHWMKDFHLRKSPPLGVILPGAKRGGSPRFFGG